MTRRGIAAVAAIAVAGLAALALRVVLEGREALAAGDDALASRRPGDAIASWESAARWYLPGAPHVDEAYDRLRGFARAYHSVAAWRAIRGAALATRSLWTPHDDDLAEANAAIAEIAADDPDPAGGDRVARLTWHLDRLVADPRPSRPIVALAVAGILCWLIGTALLVRHGATRSVGAAMAAVGVVAWVIGLLSRT